MAAIANIAVLLAVSLTLSLSNVGYAYAAEGVYEVAAVDEAFFQVTDDGDGLHRSAADGDGIDMPVSGLPSNDNGRAVLCIILIVWGAVLCAWSLIEKDAGLEVGVRSFFG